MSATNGVPCPTCGQRFSTQKNMKIHYAKTHARADKVPAKKFRKLPKDDE